MKSLHFSAQVINHSRTIPVARPITNPATKPNTKNSQAPKRDSGPGRHETSPSGVDLSRRIIGVVGPVFESISIPITQVVRRADTEEKGRPDPQPRCSTIRAAPSESAFARLDWTTARIDEEREPGLKGPALMEVRRCKRRREGRGMDIKSVFRHEAALTLSILDYRPRGARGGTSHWRRVMDWDRVEGNWKRIMGSVKEQWGKLTDDDLSVSRGVGIS